MKISDFQTITSNGINLIFSRAGISTVDNTLLWQMLRTWEQMTEVSRETIENQLRMTDLNLEEAIPFLEDVIGFEATHAPYFDEARIFYQEGSFFEPIIQNGFPTVIETKCYAMRALPDRAKTGKLDIFLLEDLTCKPTKEFYFNHARLHPGNGLVAGYLSEEAFCLTAPYIGDIGNPCLYCKIDRILHYSKIRKTHHSWAQLISFSHENLISIPQPKLTELSCKLISTFISLQINRYTSSLPTHYQDNVYLDNSINLSTGEIFSDHPTHWYLCNCRSQHG